MKKIYAILLMAFALCQVSSAKVYVPVLKEGFATAESSTPGGGYYSESLYFDSSLHSDNTGWYSNSTYEAERAVKLNAKTKTGYIRTPEINLSADAANVKVQFRAQTWTKDSIYVCIEIDGDTNTTQKVDCHVSTNVTDRSQAPYEVIFENVPTGSKFKFYAEKRDPSLLHRFYLTDVVVLEEVEEAKSADLYSSTYFHFFDDIMAGNDSEVRTVDITTVGPDCDVTIDSSKAPNFTINKADNWNAKTGGRLQIEFTPTNSGTKVDTLYVENGDNVEQILLKGNAKVYSPTVADATNIGDNSFTANWLPCAGMDNIVLTVYTKSEEKPVSSNLMFSKYIEGKSSNRAIQLFNGTGKDVSLNGWVLRMELNGAGGLVANEYALPDQVLEAGKTFSVCDANYQALREIVDVTIGYSNGGYSNIVTFTGDDAIALFDPEGNVVDLLGYESIDCNDRVSGLWGTDVTYYRKPTSYDPHPKFYVEEWDAYAMDYSTDFAVHALADIAPVRKIVAQLTLPGDAVSADIEGLLAGTNYYYAVEGISNNLLTPYSKEAAVLTTGEAGVEESVADTNAYYTLNLPSVSILANGVAVYRIDGVQLPAINNEVILPAHGVYVIKTPAGAAKIVY
jgi:hypothetical protein